MKTLIVHTMQNPFGALRLLFTTEAFGYGVDAPNVRHIVHVDPPNNLESKDTLTTVCTLKICKNLQIQ